MIIKTEKTGGKLLSAKKEKKKFSKNNSFSGMESKKSPKHRRKSIATVLATPLTKKKKEKITNEWTVSENTIDVVKRKQLVITDSTDEEIVEINTVLPKTPVLKRKRKSEIPDASKKEKKLNISSSNLKDQKEEENKIGKLSINKSSKSDEEVFGIDASDVTNAIKSVIKFRKENPKLQNQLFDDRISLALQISCHKILQEAPSRIIRIPLANCPLTPDDEICLIVPEVKGIKNIEHERHIEHYENLLRNKGVEKIKKIMTFHEFRTEYETFEQKSRLVDLYDVFLVDGRISGKVVKKCGKIFYEKRKVPTAVKLQATKLKEHIDKALSKAFLHLHMKGDSYHVEFGHDGMTTEDLVENVYSIIQGLDKEFPGGFANIKGIHVRTARATSIPIYLSFKFPKEVPTPVVKLKKPKIFKTYKDELTTLPNANVTVTPAGRVFVERIKDDDESVEESLSTPESNKEKNLSKKPKKSTSTAEIQEERKIETTKKMIKKPSSAEPEKKKKKKKFFNKNN